MIEEALPTLRCPIDPKRQSMLKRDGMTLVCDCDVKYPIRQGLPILLISEAEFPEECKKGKTLPCHLKNK